MTTLKCILFCLRFYSLLQYNRSENRNKFCIYIDVSIHGMGEDSTELHSKHIADISIFYKFPNPFPFYKYTGNLEVFTVYKIKQRMKHSALKKELDK